MNRQMRMAKFGVVLGVWLLAVALPSFGVKASQVSRDVGHIEQGQCCFLWNNTVTVTEPATVAPVALSFNLTYYCDPGCSTFSVGVSINSGPCAFYGSGVLAPSSDDRTTSYQWVVLPSDGVLKQGKNTFTVCGGSQGTATDAIYASDTTLAVRIITSDVQGRYRFNQVERGLCCYSWVESAQVTEGTKLTPVVVTWSADYINSNPEHWWTGLIVNGGPCTYYGPRELTSYWRGSFTNADFQWTVNPSDGLVSGINTFTLCGGSTASNTNAITLGYNSLTARTVGVAASQLQRVMVDQIFTGKCCSSWNEAVSVTEPATPQPVVVTWSSDYFLSSSPDLQAGFSLNGGACQVLWRAAQLDRTPANSADEWVVYPSDGLNPGKNTIALCGGGWQLSDSITVGFNTLAVRIKN
jgi:hypothetical protein